MQNQFENLNFTPAQVANFFLEKGRWDNIGIDNLKLQKLVYIAYGWSLAILNIKLFNEPIQAWRHGPVIPSLFHEFKHHGGRPITEEALEVDWEEGDFKAAKMPNLDDRLQVVLDKVWEIYKVFTGWELRDKTHQQDTPWKKAYDKDQNQPLDDNEIKKHFRERVTTIIEAAKAV